MRQLPCAIVVLCFTKIGPMTVAWVLEYYEDCSNDVLELTLTFFMSRSNMENANTSDFMESFEDFGLKIC